MITKGRLDWTEVITAALTGVRRYVLHKSRGDKNKHGEAGWDGDIESACAEKFTAKMLREYWWDGLDGKTDVGPYQVRHTCLRHGRLIIHDDDKDDEAFILVIGRAPYYEMIGWCWGREGKKSQWWEDPTHEDLWAFFVPRDFPPMHPMTEWPPANEAAVEDANQFARETLN